MLNRDVSALGGSYDLLVVGGGVFGAAAAWDATRRGLRVLLVDKGDFGSGASANSFKMVHGGIRYMQHLDLPRVRSSCYERSAFLRLAPHLVTPLPIAMPTYGLGTKGKPFLALGMWAYDAITLDRNRQIKDSSRRIPRAMCLSRAELLNEFPQSVSERSTGAVVFHDAQMYNPPRLVLAFLQSAAKGGARLLNYVAARRFDIAEGEVRGCFLEDLRTGNEYSVQCPMILNASGPWAEELTAANGIPRSVEAPPCYSRDSCFVVDRRFESKYALAVPGVDGDADAVLSRSKRHLFLVPWRDYTLVGVWHRVWDRAADDVEFDRTDLSRHLTEINSSYPDLNLAEADVRMWNAGLLPFGGQEEEENLSFGKESAIIDHATEHGVAGLVTLIGIRYTMGRADAVRALDILLRGRGAKRSSLGRKDSLSGGDFSSFAGLVEAIRKESSGRIADKTATALAHNHGTNYRSVLALAEETGWDVLGGSTVLRAEALNAVRSEMAVSLADVVFRRTDLATGGNPGEAALQECGELLASELNWDESTLASQLDKVRAGFPQLHAA